VEVGFDQGKMDPKDRERVLHGTICKMGDMSRRLLERRGRFHSKTLGVDGG